MLAEEGDITAERDDHVRRDVVHSMTKEFAKPLVLEALSRHGALIQEFRDWDLVVDNKEILLHGRLDQSGLQRICSLLDTPADLRPPATSASGNAQDDKSRVAQTTLQYFKMLELFLGDLRQNRETTQTETPGLVAMWYKQYASKIDALPVLSVDPEMVQFGTQLAGALRQAQGAMRGAGVQEASGIANMQGAQVYDYQAAAGAGVAVGPRGGVAARGGYAYRYAYNPWESLREDGAEVGQIEMNARIKGYSSANQTMDGVQVAVDNMRKHMTEKYQIEF